MVALAFAGAMPLSARVAPLPGGAGEARLGPVASALRAQLAGSDDRLLADFYRARGYRSLWIQGWRVNPEARDVLRAVSGATDDGLDPGAYGLSDLSRATTAARGGDPGALARAEIALSAALSRFAADLHSPAAGAEMVYADAAVAPPRFDRAAVLEQLARARSPAEAITELGRMNPIYEDLRAALKAWRSRRGAAATERVLLANLERARALPPDPGRRYLLVDAAAQTLWLYDRGRMVDAMPVVVGKVSEPTPMMAGLIRYAVARPYWNVPPVLVRRQVAPMVLRFGPGYLAGQNMEALSDWTDAARIVPPEGVDWSAVASGRQIQRVRQRPGPDNMMGQVKFIFPNRYGVYLHDSPLRQFFAQSRRTESAGCVRLSDAPRLARWLLADQATRLADPGAPETRLDLVRPIPVYIVYFTAAPGTDGLSFRPDIYHRDPPLEASLLRARPRA